MKKNKIFATILSLFFVSSTYAATEQNNQITLNKNSINNDSTETIQYNSSDKNLLGKWATQASGDVTFMLDFMPNGQLLSLYNGSYSIRPYSANGEIVNIDGKAFLYTINNGQLSISDGSRLVRYGQDQQQLEFNQFLGSWSGNNDAINSKVDIEVKPDQTLTITIDDQTSQSNYTIDGDILAFILNNKLVSCKIKDNNLIFSDMVMVRQNNTVAKPNQESEITKVQMPKEKTFKNPIKGKWQLVEMNGSQINKSIVLNITDKEYSFIIDNFNVADYGNYTIDNKKIIINSSLMNDSENSIDQIFDWKLNNETLKLIESNSEKTQMVYKKIN